MLLMMSMPMKRKSGFNSGVLLMDVAQNGKNTLLSIVYWN